MGCESSAVYLLRIQQGRLTGVGIWDVLRLSGLIDAKDE